MKLQTFKRWESNRWSVHWANDGGHGVTRSWATPCTMLHREQWASDRPIHVWQNELLRRKPQSEIRKHQTVSMTTDVHSITRWEFSEYILNRLTLFGVTRQNTVQGSQPSANGNSLTVRVRVRDTWHVKSRSICSTDRLGFGKGRI